MSVRVMFFIGALVSSSVIVSLALLVHKSFLYLFIPFAGPFFIGIYDMLQRKKTILNNFPFIGHFRYWFEMIRPEIQQYFVETDDNGRPFSRELRSVVYQRAKGARDTVPFGMKRDAYTHGHEWINHSINAVVPDDEDPRVMIGADQCQYPYSASLFNISAMSFGSLSTNAVIALNRGAAKGNFAHNTGEGGIFPYHLEGGDLIWQIGTGYFGCRTKNGEFDPDKYVENATRDNVKMIEVKISQGAKPGHGGILPASKVTAEVAKIRGVQMGFDVISPPSHKAFSTPLELIDFLSELRRLSGGKPVGFKLCVGQEREFFAICKAIKEKGSYPDFITVDGAEGGTGAAPLEFTNHIGTPLEEGLIFVHNALLATGLRDKIKIITSGRVIEGFDLVKRIALGADICYSARGMMFALGCIQALRCNSNDCPAGVATQNSSLVRGLDPILKSERVYRYHKATVDSFKEVIASAGLNNPSEIKPWLIQKRCSDGKVRHYGELFSFLAPGDLDKGQAPSAYLEAWSKAKTDTFR